MAPPAFYHMPQSPCSRGALLAARLLRVDVRVHPVDLFAGEQLRPDFVKMNQLHTVPTLDDNGFFIVDSHPIATYLADQYGKDDSLYPKDLQKRCIVDQRLYFDAGLLYTRLKDICFPVLFQGAKTIPEEKKKRVHEVLGWLEGYLKPTGWVAGDHITIADPLCVSSVTTIAMEGCDLERYPAIQMWIQRCAKEIPDFEEIDTAGAELFRQAFQGKLLPGQV